MKTLIAVFLALVTLANFAKADRILIYKGEMQQKTFGTLVAKNDVAITNTTSYYVFDLDTSQYNTVNYFVLKGAKGFVIDIPAAFINVPFSTAPKRTESSFILSTSVTSVPFTVSTSVFTVNNVLQEFGGSFAGEYPVVLSLRLFGVNDDGGLANDIRFTGTGVFRINLSLT